MHRTDHIRSFVVRAGRITPAQQRALDELWPRFGIEFCGAQLELDQIFGRSAQRRMEIGFGNGDVIGALAAANPEVDHLGIEVHPPGVGRLMLNAERLQLANLRIIRHDAVEVLRSSLPPASFDEILIFFPDPWHKKRHHKRRLIDADFVALLAGCLRSDGVLRLATDWQDYAQQMLAVCSASAELHNLSVDGGYVPRANLREITRFERRGQRLGHGVWDLAFQKHAAGERSAI
jgi:tRNA (guanine-N7-)-methyltransferase